MNAVQLRSTVKGSYILILQLVRPVLGLRVGRLGSYDFAAGYYLYVGSAHGSGGLAARLAYHQRPQKAHPHWHFDYLRAEGRLREAWTVAGPERLECVWCKALRNQPGLTMPVPGFGSRDTGCASHLFYSPRAPHPSLLTTVILGAVMGGPTVEIQLEIHTFDQG